MTIRLTCHYQIRSEVDGENGKSMAAMQQVLAHIKAFNERKARSKRASLIKVRLLLFEPQCRVVSSLWEQRKPQPPLSCGNLLHVKRGGCGWWLRLMAAADGCGLFNHRKEA